MNKMTNKFANKIAKILLLLVLAMLLINVVHALGVAPSREVINYDTEEHTINARIVNNQNKDMTVVIYPQGDLASYITLEKNTFKIKSTEGEVPFSYKVKLPSNLQPGTQNIDIAVIELIDEDTSKQEKAMISSSIVVIHQLKINVPYPGTFADGVLYISEGNVNSTITFTASVVNKGSNTINNVDGELVIKGPTNEELYRIKANSLKNLESKAADKLVVNWLANVNPGVYYAEFIVNYGNGQDTKQFVLRKTFMVGNFYVDIKDIKVNNFRLGAIAKFDIDLISKWNQPIQNVYGEMQVLDQQGNVLTTFKTSSVTLTPLTTSTISGYWDTKDVKVGNYDVKVILYYSDKSSEKLFKTVVGIDSIKIQDTATIGNVVASGTQGSNITSILIILVIVLVVINIAWLVYFKFLKKKE